MKAAVLGALLTAIAVATQAVELNGKVFGVSDGDTITVLDVAKTQHKIRLAGIDAPEKGQDFGQRSKESLSNLVFAKPVRIEWTKEDRYGRKVAKVWVADTNCPAASCPKTLDAGLAQITVGMAWWYRKYAREQSTEDQTRYGFAQTDAQERRAGLWRDAAPIPPWDWRSSRRAATSRTQAAAPGRAAGSLRTALAASASTVTSGSPSPWVRRRRRPHPTRSHLDGAPEASRLRQHTVEHVFGSLKFWMGSTHFLTRTLPRVRTEMSLQVLAYNMQRVIKILGTATPIAEMRA